MRVQRRGNGGAAKGRRIGFFGNAASTAAVRYCALRLYATHGAERRLPPLPRVADAPPECLIHLALEDVEELKIPRRRQARIAAQPAAATLSAPAALAQATAADFLQHCSQPRFVDFVNWAVPEYLKADGDSYKLGTAIQMMCDAPPQHPFCISAA